MYMDESNDFCLNAEVWKKGHTFATEKLTWDRPILLFLCFFFLFTVLNTDDTIIAELKTELT